MHPALSLKNALLYFGIEECTGIEKCNKYGVTGIEKCTNIEECIWYGFFVIENELGSSLRGLLLERLSKYERPRRWLMSLVAPLDE